LTHVCYTANSIRRNRFSYQGKVAQLHQCRHHHQEAIGVHASTMVVLELNPVVVHLQAVMKAISELG
jgi:hypothetical protein